MLQQTQVRTVEPYFCRFIKSFPSVRKLASAPLQSVLKAWEGLGYYSRARNLHAAAQIVSRERAGRLPRRADELKQLPGIGDYSAAAIASIAFDQPIPVVDGNVVRLFTRFLAINDDASKPIVKRKIAEFLAPVVQGCEPSTFNQAIMELGALVCRPRVPDCERCPLRRGCRAYLEDRVSEYPKKQRRNPVPHHTIAVGVISRAGRILVGKRHEDAMLGGLWEFPGGKCRAGESTRAAARRKILEETGLHVRVGSEVATVRHAYSHFKITMLAFACTVISGRARNLGCDEIRWVREADLARLPFPTANKKILDQVFAGIEETRKSD